jgi:uncharacterized RDD family membrane protein YckC
MNSTKKFFVTHNNQQYGPMSWDEVLRYNFPPNALIWYEGLKNWQPLSSLMPDTPVPPPINRPASTNMVYNENLFADFGLRLAAYLIDAVALGFASFVVGALWGLLAGRMVYTNPVGYLVFAYILSIVTGWLYFAIFESSEYQATPGKMLLKITVVDEQFKRLTFANASGRFFGKILSTIILLIGYLMVLWTPNRQALHDQIAKTFVVRKEK